jgi:hypothetical protein
VRAVPVRAAALRADLDLGAVEAGGSVQDEDANVPAQFEYHASGTSGAGGVRGGVPGRRAFGVNSGVAHGHHFGVSKPL